MSKDSAKTEQQALRLPKAPGYVTRPLEGVIGSIYNLGNTDPYQYVPSPNSNDLSAFSGGNSIAQRYGWNPNQPYSTNPSGTPSGGQGLFSSLGINAPQAQTYDWQAVADDRASREPAFQQAFDSLTPQQHSDIARVMGNADGTVNLADFARFHAENGPGWSDDMKERFGGTSGGEVMGAYGSNGFGQPMATAGKTQNPWATSAPSSGGYNPVSAYGDATSITRGAATAGPQYGDYGGVLDLLRGNAPQASAGRVSSESLLDGWEDYMNPYTDTVVDRTLASTREEQERAEARRAAAAAGSGAHRGTRNSVFEAISQIDRERQLGDLEWNMRDAAYNSGMDRSADDANRRQAAGTTNANLATQVSMANAQSDLSRLLSGANLMHAGIANNQQADERSLDRAMTGARDLTNTASTYQQNERQDLGLLSQLGAQQREIERQHATAPIALLDTIANLLGGMGVNTSQVTGVADSSTTTQRSSPGLLTSINNLVGLGSNIVGLGSDIKDLRK